MGDGAVGHLLHLLGEHGHGGLGLDDVKADEHADGDQQPGGALLGDCGPQQGTGWHKAHVHAAQEQHQTEISIQQARADTQQLVGVKVPGDGLEQDEHPGDGGQGGGHLFEIAGEGIPEAPGGICRGGKLGQLGHGVARRLRAIADAQQQHRQNGADGAQGDEAEAVAGGVGIASGGGDAQAQGHDKGHGDGPGGHAAGIEGHGDKVPRSQGGQQKDYAVEHQQQPPQGDGQADAQGGHHQEEANAHRHGEDEHQIVDGGHLLGQHLEVRLGHGGKHAQEEIAHHGQQKEFAAAHGHAHDLAHGDHGHVHPHGEQPHPADQQHCAEEKQHQNGAVQRSHGDRQQQDNGSDGQHRGHRLLDLFHKLMIEMQSGPPLK